jgi:DNA polymerase-3 subunit beta
MCRVPASDDLLTISAFARRVGLTCGALRFYDDCGLLPPAQVQVGSGYRRYAPEQEARGVLLRALRAVDLPLAEVRIVLDGPPAARVLQAHLLRLERKLEPTRRAAALGLDFVSDGGDRAQVSLDGPELASAVRQVAPAAATTDAIPALACVLLEMGEGDVSLVASDRYRLAVRALRTRWSRGGPCRLLVPVPTLTGLARRAARHDEVRIEVAGGCGTLLAGTEELPLAAVEAEFPDYRAILAGLAPPAARPSSTAGACSPCSSTATSRLRSPSPSVPIG